MFVLVASINLTPRVPSLPMSNLLLQYTSALAFTLNVLIRSWFKRAEIVHKHILGYRSGMWLTDADSYHKLQQKVTEVIW